MCISRKLFSFFPTFCIYCIVFGTFTFFLFLLPLSPYFFYFYQIFRFFSMFQWPLFLGARDKEGENIHPLRPGAPVSEADHGQLRKWPPAGQAAAQGRQNGAGQAAAPQEEVHGEPPRQDGQSAGSARNDESEKPAKLWIIFVFSVNNWFYPILISCGEFKSKIKAPSQDSAERRTEKNNSIY